MVEYAKPFAELTEDERKSFASKFGIDAIDTKAFHDLFMEEIRRSKAKNKNRTENDKRALRNKVKRGNIRKQMAKQSRKMNRGK